MSERDYKRNRTRRSPFSGYTGLALGLLAGLGIGLGIYVLDRAPATSAGARTRTGSE